MPCCCHPPALPQLCLLNCLKDFQNCLASGPPHIPHISRTDFSHPPFCNTDVGLAPSQVCALEMLSEQHRDISDPLPGPESHGLMPPHSMASLIMSPCSLLATVTNETRLLGRNKSSQSWMPSPARSPSGTHWTPSPARSRLGHTGCQAQLGPVWDTLDSLLIPPPLSAVLLEGQETRWPTVKWSVWFSGNARS